MTTLHAYPEFLYSGDRLAATVWNIGRPTAASAVTATIGRDSEAIVLRVANSDGRYVAIGLAPGGLG